MADDVAPDLQNIIDNQMPGLPAKSDPTPVDTMAPPAQTNTPAPPAQDVSTTPNIGIPLLPIPQLDTSAILGGLKDVVGAKNTALDQTIVALGQNNTLQKDFDTRQDARTNDTVAAYDRLTAIARNPFNIVAGLWDPQFNPKYQQAKIQGLSVASQVDAAKTKALMDINNQAPAIAEMKSKIANENFELQKGSLDLVGKFYGIDQKTIELRQGAARLAIDMSDAQRKQVQDALHSMTLQQAKATFAQASAGKGPWAGKQGFLEEYIDNEEKSAEALKGLKIANDKNDFDLINEKQKVFAAKVPTWIAQPKIAEAMQTQSPFVRFGTGPDALDIPTNVMMDAYQNNVKVNESINGSLLAQSLDSVNTDLNQVATMASALSTHDPRAANEFKFIAAAQKNTDVGNPASVAQFRTTLAASRLRLQDIAKTASGTFQTPEAKAAVMGFAETGKFDLNGANAVLYDVIGKPGTQNSKFSSAFNVINTAVATKLAEKGLTGGLSVDPNASAADTMMAIAAALKSKDQDKVAETKAAVLADPTVTRAAGNEISGAIASDILQQTVSQLGSTGGPSAIFAQTLKMRQNRQFDLTTQDLAEMKREGIDTATAAVGQFSLWKMQSFLEQQSALTKYGTDYNQALIDAARARAIAVQQNGLQDPQMGIPERAISTAIFGENPESYVASDFIARLQRNAAVMHAQMIQQIGADQSGIPQGNAVATTIKSGVDPMTFAKTGQIPPAVRDAAQQAGQNAPSATGTNKSADYIKKLYGK